jgi:hypothetical protein
VLVTGVRRKVHAFLGLCIKDILTGQVVYCPYQFSKASDVKALKIEEKRNIINTLLFKSYGEH